MSRTQNSAEGEVSVALKAQKVQRAELQNQIANLKSHEVGSELEQKLLDDIRSIDTIVAILEPLVGKKRAFKRISQSTATDDKQRKQTSKTSKLSSKSTLNDHCQIVVNSTEFDIHLSNSFDFIINQFNRVDSATNLILQEESITVKLKATLNNKDAGTKWVLKSLIVLNNMISCATDDQFVEIMTTGDKTFINRLVEMMLVRNSNEIQVQAVWLLDNIVQDFGVFRQQVLDAHIMKSVLKIFGDNRDAHVVDKTTGLLSHLTYHGGLQPSASYIGQIVELLPLLASLLDTKESNKAMVVNICHALSNLTESHEDMSSTVFSCEGIVMQLVRIIERKKANFKVQAAALDVLKNLTNGTSSTKSKQLIVWGILHPLKRLMTSSDTIIAGVACATLSNLCGDDNDVIQSVLDCGFVPGLIRCSSFDSLMLTDVRLYSRYALMFIFHGATPQQSIQLIADGAFECVLSILPQIQIDEGDSPLDPLLEGMYCEALLCIEIVLSSCEIKSDFDEIVAKIDAADGWKRIAHLLESNNSTVNNKLANIASKLNRDMLCQAAELELKK